MISIYEIKGWSDVAAFLIWTLAVCAIAKAMFGSLVAAELQYRFSLRDAPRRQRMNRLNWEINNRTHWSEDAARNTPHAAKVPLADKELETKRRELAQLTRKSFGVRALQYFMGCLACQAFWTALTLFIATRGMNEFGSGLLSAAGYSGLAVVLAGVAFHRPGATGGAGTPAGKCPGCQK